MSVSPRSKVSVLSTASILLSLYSSSVYASCKHNICVKGTDDGGTHNVYVYAQRSEFITHYNVRFPYGKQIELSPNDTRFSFPVKSGRSYTFSVQWCVKGDFLSSSKCGPWVAFDHAVP